VHSWRTPNHNGPNVVVQNLHLAERCLMSDVRDRDIAVLAFALGGYSAAFGLASASYGISGPMAIAMSLLMYAGASQFAALGILATGGSVVTAIIAVAFINVRFAALGLSVGPRLSYGPTRRLFGAQLMCDPVAALSLAPSSDARASVVYWRSGIGLFVGWNLATLLGVFAAGSLTDPEALGLDSALPAALIGIIVPWLRDRDKRRAAAFGVALTLALLPFAPAGVPVIAAGLGGVLAIMLRSWGTRGGRG